MRQLGMEAPPVGVLLEPVAQARPLAQERLVRDLGGPLADRHEAAVRQPVEDAIGLELLERHAAPYADTVLVVAGETQEDAAGDMLLLGVEALVCALRQSRHRAPHSAGALIRCETQPVAVASLPQLQQRGRQQR